MKLTKQWILIISIACAVTGCSIPNPRFLHETTSDISLQSSSYRRICKINLLSKTRKDVAWIISGELKTEEDVSNITYGVVPDGVPPCHRTTQRYPTWTEKGGQAAPLRLKENELIYVEAVYVKDSFLGAGSGSMYALYIWKDNKLNHLRTLHKSEIEDLNLKIRSILGRK